MSHSQPNPDTSLVLAMSSITLAIAILTAESSERLIERYSGQRVGKSSQDEDVTIDPKIVGILNENKATLHKPILLTTSGEDMQLENDRRLRDCRLLTYVVMIDLKAIQVLACQLGKTSTARAMNLAAVWSEVAQLCLMHFSGRQISISESDWKVLASEHSRLKEHYDSLDPAYATAIRELRAEKAYLKSIGEDEDVLKTFISNKLLALQMIKFMIHQNKSPSKDAFG